MIQQQQGRKTQEGPKTYEYQQTQEGLKTQEGPKTYEYQQTQEGRKTQEGLKTYEGQQTQEGRKTQEGPKTYEYQQTQEGLKTQEGPKTYEYQQTQEGRKTQEGLKTYEGQQTQEGLKTQEGPKTQADRLTQEGQQTQEINIILIGKTGAGKSSVANALTGSKEFKESADLNSETYKCQTKQAFLFNKQGNLRINVIDTPGFMDSKGTDFQTYQEIFNMMNSIKEQGFHVALFCFSATEMRCDGSVSQALQLITKLMDEQVLKHIYIVITQMNNLEQGYSIKQEQKIKDQVPIILKQNKIILNYDTIFVYKHGEDVNGLESLQTLLQQTKAYVPQICKDFMQNYVPNDLPKTMENLSRNSQNFQQMELMMQKFQDLYLMNAKTQEEMQKANAAKMNAIIEENKAQAARTEQRYLEREKILLQKSADAKHKRNLELDKILIAQSAERDKIIGELSNRIVSLSQTANKQEEKKGGCSIM